MCIYIYVYMLDIYIYIYINAYLKIALGVIQDPADNRLSCRTAYSPAQIIGKNGHMESKTHIDNKASAQQKPPLVAMFGKLVPDTSASSSSQLDPIQDKPTEPKPRPVCFGTCYHRLGNKVVRPV